MEVAKLTYIQQNPASCASLAVELLMFTYEITNGVSVSAGLGFEKGKVGGLQNIAFVGAR